MPPDPPASLRGMCVWDTRDAIARRERQSPSGIHTEKSLSRDTWQRTMVGRQEVEGRKAAAERVQMRGQVLSGAQRLTGGGVGGDVALPVGKYKHWLWRGPEDKRISRGPLVATWYFISQLGPKCAAVNHVPALPVLRPEDHCPSVLPCGVLVCLGSCNRMP